MRANFENVLLEPEQKTTLSILVEAARNTPREKRQKFLFVRTMDGSILMHPGLIQERRDIYYGDIEQLAAVGFLNLSHTPSGFPQFDVTPKGFEYYEWMKQQNGQPVQNIETEIRNHLDADGFRRHYPAAYQKWAEAEAKLWSSDSEQKSTTIGHLCREALQEFAKALVAKYQPPNVEKDVQKTVARLKAVIGKQSGQMSDAVKAYLDALVDYWGTVN